MFMCHPAAKIPCQLGGSSMGLNFSLCMPTGWLNLSFLSLNKRKNWWFEQMFCKLGAGCGAVGEWCGLWTKLCHLPPVLPVCAPHLVPSQVLFQRTEITDCQRERPPGQEELAGCAWLWAALSGGAAAQLWGALGEGSRGGEAAAERSKGWRCLGLGLHTVPGQGDMARAWIAVKSESHSLPSWVCWEWLSPRGSQGSLRLLNPKKWQQFSNIIFWARVGKVVQFLSMNTQIGLGVAEIDQMYWNQLIWECPCKGLHQFNIINFSASSCISAVFAG